MVNVMCELDWAIECPVVWSNSILAVSLRGFCVMLTFKSVV